MKYRLMAFMAGRNGFDALSNTLIWASILAMFASRLIPNQVAHMIAYEISVLVFVYGYFRVMSRNLPKRHRENMAFVGFFQRRKLNFQQRKTHRFFGCPQCKATLRVPKGKGRIVITCPRCGNEIHRKS